MFTQSNDYIKVNTIRNYSQRPISVDIPSEQSILMMMDLLEQEVPLEKVFILSTLQILEQDSIHKIY